MNIGDGVKHYRKLRGYSQARLGDAVGMKREYLCKIETGAYPNPTPRTLKKILVVLNVKLGEFFDFIGE
jgi:transcriptional regulator with XRE-family HTH domain